MYNIFKPKISKKLRIPLYNESVRAGFPSPADDFIDRKLDLNDYLVKHPAATFFVRVTGDSMKDCGIFTGDILVVDKSLDAVDGSIVIAVVDAELTVKRLKKHDGKLWLYPENKSYKPLEIKESHQFSIWGVVTSVIHKVS